MRHLGSHSGGADLGCQHLTLNYYIIEHLVHARALKRSAWGLAKNEGLYTWKNCRNPQFPMCLVSSTWNIP